MVVFGFYKDNSLQVKTYLNLCIKIRNSYLDFKIFANKK